jgi:cytidine deaminase
MAGAVSPASSTPDLQADLGPDELALLDAARHARGAAYAPYSGFSVGAAALTTSGHIYAGANMENASFGVTVCAEIGALQAALTANDFRIETIAIVGGLLDGGSSEPVSPCGRCRQLILEAGQVAGTNVRVLCANADLSQVLVTDIETLLPHAFGPSDLKG